MQIKTAIMGAMTTVAALSFFGCATTQTPVIPIESLRAEPIEVPEIDPEIANRGIQKSTLTTLTTGIDWPSMPGAEDCATNIVTSAVDDGVLVQGRAYVKRSLDDIYGDLITPLIIGPVHMTTDIELRSLEETPLKTTFVLQNTIKYIMTVDLELTWTIEPVFENGRRVGYYGTAEKTNGSWQIKQISNKLQILEIEPGLVSVEITSFNRAAMDKEEESKTYVTKLFDFWSKACHMPQNASATGDAAEAATDSVEPTETAAEQAPSDE